MWTSYVSSATLSINDGNSLVDPTDYRYMIMALQFLIILDLTLLMLYMWSPNLCLFPTHLTWLLACAFSWSGTCGARLMMAYFLKPTPSLISWQHFVILI